MKTREELCTKKKYSLEMFYYGFLKMIYLLRRNKYYEFNIPLSNDKSLKKWKTFHIRI